jgi:hypothetical protein
MLQMLHQLISVIAPHAAPKNTTRLQPTELQELLDAVPEVARKLSARQPSGQSQPRSVCTSLSDLCEL